MKVLITGRTGQLARSLLERGQGRQDLELIAVGRPQLDLERVGNAAAIVLSIRPDIVINTAAYTAVDLAEAEPERAFRINADGAGELAEAARRIGARIIQISTDYVFDGRSPVPYRPTDPAAPINVYGRSKLVGETQVQAATDEWLIVRTSWLFSPYGHNFVHSMLRLADEQELVSIVSDQWGSPTSALDLSDCLLAILARWRDGDRLGLGQVYHAANKGATNWAEFARTIFAQAADIGRPAAQVCDISLLDRQGRARRPINSRLDTSAFAVDFEHTIRPWQIAVQDVVRRFQMSPLSVGANSAQPRRPSSTVGPA